MAEVTTSGEQRDAADAADVDAAALTTSAGESDERVLFGADAWEVGHSPAGARPCAACGLRRPRAARAPGEPLASPLP